MDQALDNFFDLSVTSVDAAKFDVVPQIHRDDFIFIYHMDGHAKRTLEASSEIYFRDGDHSVRELDGLIKRILPGRTGLSVLEFASGYGCLTRHFKHLDAGYAVTSCDIHRQAVDFISGVVGVDAVVSDRVPEQLAIGRVFDVVFALSFFSHMPPETFGRWINRLMDHVAPNGILIVTTHGRSGQAAISVDTLGEDGFWFRPLSEQRDLPTSDYGTALVRPHVVFDALSGRGDCTLRFYQEAMWWGVQDVYVFERVPAGSVTNRAKPVVAPPVDTAPLEAEIGALHAKLGGLRTEVDELRQSTSWRLTAPLRALKRRLEGVRPR